LQLLDEALSNPEQAVFINQDLLQEYRGSGGVIFIEFSRAVKVLPVE
jgi:hypothetical protein